MLFSKATSAIALLLLTFTTASPFIQSGQARNDLPALAPVANLTSGLGILTFQIDNFQRSNPAAKQKILESITDAQKLSERLSYDALRSDDVSHAPEATAAAKQLGEQLRALFAAIDNRRTTGSAAKSSSSSSTTTENADAAPRQSPVPEGGDGIIDDIYSGAVSLLATIQDALPEYFWILVAAT